MGWLNDPEKGSIALFADNLPIGFKGRIMQGIDVSLHLADARLPQ